MKWWWQNPRGDEEVTGNRLVAVHIGGEQPAEQWNPTQYRDALPESRLLAHGVPADQEAASFRNNRLGLDDVLGHLRHPRHLQVRTATIAVLDVNGELDAPVISVVDDVRTDAHHPTI